MLQRNSFVKGIGSSSIVPKVGERFVFHAEIEKDSITTSFVTSVEPIASNCYKFTTKSGSVYVVLVSKV